MRTYVAFLVSAGLTIAALAAVILLHGGWEAGAAALALMAGLAFLVTLIALLTVGEGPSSPGPRARAV
jgi:hypothetical protein